MGAGRHRLDDASCCLFWLQNQFKFLMKGGAIWDSQKDLRYQFS